MRPSVLLHLSVSNMDSDCFPGEEVGVDGLGFFEGDARERSSFRMRLATPRAFSSAASEDAFSASFFFAGFGCVRRLKKEVDLGFL